MQVTLVHEAPLKFVSGLNGNDNKFSGRVKVPTVSTLGLKVNHFIGTHTHLKLQNKINSMINIGNAGLNCSMRIIKEKDKTEDYLCILWTSSGNQSFFHSLSPAIRNAAGLIMKVEFGGENNNPKVSQVFPLKTLIQRDDFWGIIIHCVGIPIAVVNQWNQALKSISMKLTLNMILNTEFLNASIADGDPINHCHSILANLLEDKDDGDIVIRTASGTTVKCHWAVLKTSCGHFRDMSKSGMKEVTDKEIIMDDMEENEVRAFLAYVYTGNVKPANENIQIAWKLLKLGDCYRYHQLVSAMREILMVKGNEEYTVDFALDMLLFAKKIGDLLRLRDGEVGRSASESSGVWKDLSLKALYVLKWYTKEKPMELMGSEEYKKLHNETPKIAMQLHAIFISFANVDEIDKSGLDWIKDLGNRTN